MTPRDLNHFSAVKEELEKLGLFLDMDTVENEFIVGEKRYRKKWKSLLDKMDAKAPIGVFDSLDEVRAFAIGYSIAKKLAWPG